MVKKDHPGQMVRCRVSGEVIPITLLTGDTMELFGVWMELEDLMANLKKKR